MTTTTTKFALTKSRITPILAIAAQVATRDQNQVNAGLVRISVFSGLLVDIEAFDGTIGMFAREAVCTGPEDTEVVNAELVLDAKTLYSRVHEGLADGEILVEQTQTATTGRVSLSTRGFKRTFGAPCGDVGAFRPPPPIDRILSVEIPAPVLRRALRAVEYAAHKEPHVTQSVLLQPMNGELRATATDGARLARAVVAVEGLVEGAPVLVPSRIAKLLDKVLRDDDPVTISTNGQHVWFATAGYTFSAPRTDPGSYPLVDRVIGNAAQQCVQRLTFDREDLEAELAAAAVVSDRVQLSFADGSLSIAGSGSSGEDDVFCMVSAALEHATDGKASFPGCVARTGFLLDAIQACRESKKVSVDVDDAATMFRVTSDGVVAIISAT